MFGKTFSAVLGLAAVVAAQLATFDPIYTPTAGQVVKVGETLKITWSAQPAEYASGLVKLHLIGGPTQNTQVPLYDIVSGLTNSVGSYDWVVPATNADQAFYGIVISLQSDPVNVFQYSNPFKVVSNGAVPSSSAVSTTAVVTPSATATNNADDDQTSVTVTLSSVNPPAVTATVDVTTTTCEEDAATTVATSAASSSVVVVVPTAPAGNSSVPVVKPTSTKFHTLTSTSVAPSHGTQTVAPTVVPIAAAGATSASLAFVGFAAVAALML